MATPERTESDSAQYTSEAVLHVDQSAQSLSAQNPKVLSETSTQAHRSNGGTVIGDVTGIAHGTYQNRAVTFVTFSIRFPYEKPQSWHRITEAAIEISFRPTRRGDPWPRIVQFAPSFIQDGVQHASVRKNVAAGLSVSSPDPVVPLEGSLNVEKEVQFTQRHGTTMGGSVGSSNSAFQAGLDGVDVARWQLAENALQGDGIPTVVKLAVMVETAADSFQILVSVGIATAGKLFYRGWPWSRQRPLLVKRSVAFGPVAMMTLFDPETFGMQNWRAVVGWNRPHEQIQVTSDYDLLRVVEEEEGLGAREADVCGNSTLGSQG